MSLITTTIEERLNKMCPTANYASLGTLLKTLTESGGVAIRESSGDGSGEKLNIKSPDGSQWNLTINDAGEPTWTKVS